MNIRMVISVFLLLIVKIVLLEMARKIYPDIEAVFSDAGLEIP